MVERLQRVTARADIERDRERAAGKQRKEAAKLVEGEMRAADRDCIHSRAGLKARRRQPIARAPQHRTRELNRLVAAGNELRIFRRRSDNMEQTDRTGRSGSRTHGFQPILVGPVRQAGEGRDASTCRLPEPRPEHWTELFLIHHKWIYVGRSVVERGATILVEM